MDIMIGDSMDINYLDEIFLENNILKILPASEYAKVPYWHLRLFCHNKGFYSLPTLELIEWLREQIADEVAIEIGCGHGAIGRMCFRTLLRSFFIPRVKPAIAHNALDDAKAQALTLIKVWELIKNGTHPKIWGAHEII